MNSEFSLLLVLHFCPEISRVHIDFNQYFSLSRNTFVTSKNKKVCDNDRIVTPSDKFDLYSFQRGEKNSQALRMP